jgi:hypothetical protein
MDRTEVTRFALLALKECERERARMQDPGTAARQCLSQWMDQYAPDEYDEEMLERIAKDAVQFSAYIQSAWVEADKRRDFNAPPSQERPGERCAKCGGAVPGSGVEEEDFQGVTWAYCSVECRDRH